MELDIKETHIKYIWNVNRNSLLLEKKKDSLVLTIVIVLTHHLDSGDKKPCFFLPLYTF